MRKSSKVFCLLFAVLMLFTLSVTAFAGNETNDGNIKIQVATDKGSYGATGVAEMTATITNISGEDINNVTAQAVFDDLAPAGKRKSETSKSVDVLKAGESFSFTYKATLNKNEHKLNIFQKIILWFVRLFNGGYNANNNNIDVVAECVTEIDFGKFTAENVIQVGYEENYISKSEWILMLADVLNWNSQIENIQIEDINSFVDIANKECEKVVKYATFLGIFDSAEEKFYPNLPATKEFVALTAVRGLNFYPTKSIDTLDKNLIQYPTEAYTAVSIGILETENNYFYPQKPISMTQSTKILESISEILDSTVIDSNHENEIDYTDKVIELSSQVQYQQNGTIFEFVISEETDKLKAGSIFILADYTPYKVKSVSKENGKYIVQTEEPTIEETLNSMNIEGSENVTSGSFIPADGVEVIQPYSRRSAINMENIHLSLNKEIEKDIFLYADLTIKNPKVEYKIDIDWSKVIPNFNNVYLKFIFDAEIKGGFKDSENGKTGPSKAGGIVLGKIPVFGAFGTGIYIEIAIEYDIEGKIELIMTMNGETGFQIYHNQPKGIANFPINFEFPSLEATAKFGPKISGLLGILNKWDLIDFYLYAGGAAKGSLKIRDNGMSCLSAYTYAFAELSALKDGVIGDWLNLKYSWNIWDENNSFLKKNLHFENLTMVPECTYNDEEIIFGNVSGTVIDNETNKPVPGVKVYCTELDISTTTNNDGIFYFNIDDLSKKHSFNFSHELYNGIKVTILSNSYSMLKEVKLSRKSGSVTGTVLEETTEKPMNGVTVCFTSDENCLTTRTDGNGKFNMGLPTGEYKITVCDTDTHYCHESRTITVKENEEIILSPAFYMKQGTKVTGKIVDKETKAPLSGITLEVFDITDLFIVQKSDGDGLYYYDDLKERAELVTTVTTDENGEYFFNAPVGDYVITVNHENYKYYDTAFSLDFGLDEYFVNNIRLVVSIVTASGECGANGDNVTWTLYEDGELVISGSGKMKDYYNSSPWSSYRESIKSIKIEEGITKISRRSFENCIYVETIYIPNSVNYIESASFSGCTSLKDITIGKNLVRVGQGAFDECISLENVYYLGDISSWCNISFDFLMIQYYENQYGISSNPLNYAKNLFVDGELLVLLEIPNEVTEIKQANFFGYDKLEEVILPEKIIKIGSGAFYGCSNIKSIVIPRSITHIGEAAFCYCVNLSDVYFNDGSSLAYISSNLFKGCHSLSNIIVPKTVTGISSYAFAHSGLKEIEMFENITSIGQGAFYNCRNLQDIVIPDSVKTIGRDTFYYCPLVNITLGKSLTKIDLCCFEGCHPTNVYYTGDISSWCNIDMDKYFSLDNLFINNELLTVIEIPAKVEAVKNFKGCDSITKVIIQNGVTNIGSEAFSYCDNLETVIIPDSVVSIGTSAFSSCYKLSEVILGNNVTEISEKAFYSCKRLEEVVLPDSIAIIGEEAFGMFASRNKRLNLSILNPNCEIYDSNSTIEESIIYGYTNSTAQEYAKKYGKTFIALD